MVDTAPLMEPSIKSRLYSESSLRARLFQILWVIFVIVPNTACPLLLLWAFGPRLGVVEDSVLDIVWKLLFAKISVGIVFITPLQILAGRGASTVIPCIQASWYKVFNL